MGEAAPRQDGDRAFFPGAKPAGARSRKPGMIEPKRMADQNTRVELGRIDAAGAKFGGPRAPRLRNRARICALAHNGGAGFRAGRHHAVSSAASSAA